MMTDGQCEIVEEGDIVLSEVDASGNEYMLIEAGVSWSSARQTCQVSVQHLRQHTPRLAPHVHPELAYIFSNLESCMPHPDMVWNPAARIATARVPNCASVCV